MIGRLVARHLALRPVRSLVFVGAYAAGVGVMLALLSIGDVMVEQARDEEWVGGGDITVLPAGVDLETLRLGGATFYRLEGARFIGRQVLGGPRLADRVQAIAPWIDDRPLYIRADPATEPDRTAGATPMPVRAAGQIPSAARALGAAPDLLTGSWEDTEADRRWLSPTPFELYTEIDRFHRPPPPARTDTTWAEWHYFNLLWPDQGRWLYLSYIAFGDVMTDEPGARTGGVVLGRWRTPDGLHRTFADSVAAGAVQVSVASPDVTFGPHTVRLLDDPARYRLRARLPGDGGGPPLVVELDIEPGAHRYFPPTELPATDSFVSGYVVPALRGTATGRVCVGGSCVDAGNAIAYHDHNWGTWGGVTWDWGVAHAGDLDVLYGGVHDGADGARAGGAGEPRFLAYAVDSLGVAGVLTLGELEYAGARSMSIAGRPVEVPETLTWTARRDGDSLSAEIALRHAALSRIENPNAGTPDANGAGAVAVFAQMQGLMALEGRLGGRDVREIGPGFFETYIRTGSDTARAAASSRRSMPPSDTGAPTKGGPR